MFEDFNRLSADESGVPQHARFEQLAGACAVVDALGVECRREMIEWFCTWQAGLSGVMLVGVGCDAMPPLPIKTRPPPSFQPLLPLLVTQFAPYKHAFQPYGEAGSLDKTELRYSWHRQLLKKYDEQFVNLFPPSWQMSLAITRNFCAISHKHLEEILDQTRGSLDVSQVTAA